MKLSIGFNRHLEADWLAQSASWVSNGIEGQDLKDRIDSMLEPAFTSKVAKDKTRNLLFGVWNKLPKHVSKDFQDRGAALLLDYSECHLVFHWGMMLAKYPFFTFVVGQIGRLTKLNDTFMYSQLEDRVTEHFGDTSTIKRSMQFVVRTLINLGVLKSPKQGVYTLSRPIEISSSKVKGWLIEAALLSESSTSRSLSSINNDSVWFPFTIYFDLADVQANSKLEAHIQSSDSVIFLYG